MPSRKSKERTAARRAARELAAAFGTIEKFKEYVPDYLYNQIHEGLCEHVDETRWQSDPKLSRQILEVLLSPRQ